MWEEHGTFDVHCFKLEVPRRLTSKWKCQVGRRLFERRASARGQRCHMRRTAHILAKQITCETGPTACRSWNMGILQLIAPWLSQPTSRVTRLLLVMWAEGLA